MSDKELKVTAMLLSALVTTGDEALDDFRRRRLGWNAPVELDDLRRLRSVLLLLGEALQRREPAAWERVLRVASWLEGGAPSTGLGDASTSLRDASPDLEVDADVPVTGSPLASQTPGAVSAPPPAMLAVAPPALDELAATEASPADLWSEPSRFASAPPDELPGAPAPLPPPEPLAPYARTTSATSWPPSESEAPPAFPPRALPSYPDPSHDPEPGAGEADDVDDGPSTGPITFVPPPEADAHASEDVIPAGLPFDRSLPADVVASRLASAVIDEPSSSTNTPVPPPTAFAERLGAAPLPFRSTTPSVLALEEPPLPDLPLELYATLRAAIAAFPARGDEMRARYGIVDVRVEARLDAHWQARFAGDPQLRARFDELAAHYRTWFESHGDGASGPT